MAERRPTVVLLATGFSEPGGCAVHGRKLAEELTARGYAVQVLARNSGGCTFARFRDGNLSVLEVPGFDHRAAGALLYFAVALPLAVIRRPPAAFIGFQLSATATVASLAATLHRRRLLIFSTMTGDRGEVAFVRASRFGKLRRRILARASVLVAQTDQGAVELAQLLPSSEIAVVPTPVRLPATVPALTGQPTVAFSGRLVRQKNLVTLLRAWRSVIGSVPGARLTLIGAGSAGDPTESELRQMLADDPRLDASVEITGWVDDVAGRLERADVFAFPSAFEGMSNALLEACALGRVVVASSIPANRAVLGDDFPLLIDPEDTVGLSEALLRALSDDAVRTLARDRALGQARRSDVVAVGASLERLIRGR